jgi:hypothetical protein
VCDSHITGAPQRITPLAAGVWKRAKLVQQVQVADPELHVEQRCCRREKAGS